MSGLPGVAPVSEVAEWVGVDPRWLERLVDCGQIRGSRREGRLEIDPREVGEFLRGARGDEIVPSDIASLRETSVALASGADPESVCGSILERTAESLGASSGAILLKNESPSPGYLREISVFGPRHPAVLDALRDIGSWVVITGDPLLLTLPRDGELRPEEARGPHDTLAVPFTLDGRVLGSLVLVRGLESPAFTDRDLAAASVVAATLALAVERAQIQVSLKRRLEESQLAQRQMEAYALDVRETFAAERERSVQLKAALEELEQTYLATVRGMAVAVEAKDAYTAGHIVRVTRYGLMMLEALAPEEAADPSFEYGFLLHDVGKLCVPDAVLGKPGPLTDDEWEIMRRHPETGRRILEGIPFLEGAAEIVYQHHERWDGAGYPQRLAAEDICLGARVFPIADAFDAMTSDRPYRRALPTPEALGEIASGSGTQFWPDAVEVFLALSQQALEEVRSGSAYGDPLRRG
jgi:HD-GYP domain-containing protein (c-di-GMP phosphodiesterase class II)